MLLTPVQTRKNLLAFPPYDRKRLEQLHEIERNAIAGFMGTFDELEAALGVLHLGDYLGWKPLVLIHNKRTIRKYEEILGVKLRDLFEPEGPGAHRSVGYMLAVKIGNFWKAVSGEVKDEDLKVQRRSMI